MNFTPKILFFVCLLFICESAVCTGKTLINFQELDLAEVGQAGKKIMVSFTAE